MNRLIAGLIILLTLSGYCLGDGFSTFKLGPDARSGALGMTGAAFYGNSASAYWNPAGMAGLRGYDFQLSLHQWIAGVRSEFLSFGYGAGESAAGLHILYTSIGDIEHRTGPAPVPLFTFSSYELIAGFTYARRIFTGFSAGINIKMLYEKIYVHEALGFGADLGVRYRIGKNGPLLGGSVQNFGFSGKMEDEQVRLPLTARIGLMMPFSSGQWNFTAALDAVKERGFPLHIHSGFEAGWHMAFLRAGYMSGYDTRSWTAGLGLQWKKYRLDYSFMPLTMGLGESHRLTVSIGY